MGRSSRGLTRTSSSCQDQGLPPRAIKLDSNRKVLKRATGAGISSAAHAPSPGISSVDRASGNDYLVAEEIDAELQEINAQLAEIDSGNAPAADNASSNS